MKPSAGSSIRHAPGKELPEPLALTDGKGGKSVRRLRQQGSHPESPDRKTGRRVEGVEDVAIPASDDSMKQDDDDDDDDVAKVGGKMNVEEMFSTMMKEMRGVRKDVRGLERAVAEAGETAKRAEGMAEQTHWEVEEMRRDMKEEIDSPWEAIVSDFDRRVVPEKLQIVF